MEGKEKTFEVMFMSQEHCFAFLGFFLFIFGSGAYRVTVDTGKRDGEAKDAVPAGQTTRSRSCRDGASDDKCQQRWDKHTFTCRPFYRPFSTFCTESL